MAVLSIPYFRPYRSGREEDYLLEAAQSLHHSGDGPFSKRCHAWLEERLQVERALLTTSCTTALELAAVLARGEVPLSEELEVIVPGYTFVSTANAFVLHGYRPVFVDIRPDTCNLDESLVEAAITSRTRVIVPVHYAGVPCEMEALTTLAKQHNIVVIEDAAQALTSSYRGTPAGALGDMACFSFHATKNIGCGEGGAITFRDARFTSRAEIVREKGTNRKQFLRGLVDKYTWVDVGGSYLPSDLLAAYLLAQLEAEAGVHERRRARYLQYQEGLQDAENAGHLRLPHIPEGIVSNHHLFHIVLESETIRDQLMDHLKKRGIGAVSHYGALHLSKMGQHFGPQEGALPVTERVARCLLRLPLYPDLAEAEAAQVVREVRSFFAP